MSNVAFRRVMSERARGLPLFCLVLAVLVALPALTVRAAIITVDTTTDELDDGGGDCSLREAIQAANTDSPVDGCNAGSGTDTINLDAAGGNYTLTLENDGASEDANATGDLDISSSLTIQGDGADVTTINGGGIERVIHIISGTVNIFDVTITGGSSAADGGGIRNQGDLTLDGVAVDDNEATGTADAGGVLNGTGETLTIQNSTISNNTADNNAGGIQNNGTLEMTNSTISGNTAAGNAGGINNSDTVELNNVTITDNAASGGVGGGVFNRAESTFTLSNTILAENRDNGFSSPDCFTEVDGDLDSNGFNILGDNSDCGGLTDGINGDQVGSDLSPINPGLGPLQNNGGTTETHLPNEGSFAIDMVSDESNCEATDQRGEPRPVDFDGDGNARCDIGSVERQTDDTGDGGGTGNCSLAGESVKVGSSVTNVLITLIPAFAIGFRILRKRARKNKG